MFRIAPVILVLVAVSANNLYKQPIGPLSEDNLSRIVNGQTASRGNFPHHVAVVYFQTSTFYKMCGGSLICNSWVLTAAHCIQGKSASRFALALGGVNRSLWPNETGLITRRVTNYYVHPNFSNTYKRNDVGLMRLSRTVSFTANIAPIHLGHNYVGSGVAVTLSGFGRSSPTSTLSNLLKYINMTTITNQDCITTYGTQYITTETLCSSTSSGNGCNGDSGGALVVYENNRASQVGIASFILGSCPSARPSGFVRVASYGTWITNTINNTCTLVT